MIHLEFHILRPSSIHLPLLPYLPLSPTAPPPKEKKANKKTKSYLFFFYKTLLWWQFWNSVFCVKSRWTFSGRVAFTFYFHIPEISWKKKLSVPPRKGRPQNCHHCDGTTEMNNGTWFIEILKSCLKDAFPSAWTRTW